MCFDTAAAKDVMARSPTLNLHCVFATAAGGEVRMYVARWGWVDIEILADGALLVMRCGVREGIDVERDGVVGEEVGDLEVLEAVWHVDRLAGVRSW
jgi:hypothetical protein